MRKLVERAAVNETLQAAFGKDTADLIARIQELEAALKPFAEAADVFAREYPAMLEKPATSCGIRFDALQAARSALGEQPEVKE